MVNINQVAEIGLLIGEPARTSMLCALMDGQALTATELARCANVTPQTASAHLAKLTEAGLLDMQKQGRHRYHRIASAEVARLLESVMQIAADTPRRKVTTGPRDKAMCYARTCYDHFAGRLGVAITDQLVHMQLVTFEGEAGTISTKGIEHLASFGINIDEQAGKRRTRRPICRPCLDWSERRPHIAGRVGAAICQHFLDNRLVLRKNGTRVLTVTRKGEQALKDIFQIRRL